MLMSSALPEACAPHMSAHLCQRSTGCAPDVMVGADAQADAQAVGLGSAFASAAAQVCMRLSYVSRGGRSQLPSQLVLALAQTALQCQNALALLDV